MSVAMEDSAAKDQSGSGRSTSRLLRYPLRSATKSKDEKPPLVDSSNSATKRGRAASSVSKSVSVLNLSGKEKSSAKPPRRLSVPSKPNATPAPKSVGNITPISEARVKRSAVSQGKSDTPGSDVSKSSNRKKFSTLSSASYWLNQIKLSESAAKHSISLGFFKLALEAGCEPIQRMSDELKSYARRHDISEFGEFVKDLFQSYKISETLEPSQAPVDCSQMTAEGNQSSDDDGKSSSSSITDAENLKPKLLDINIDETQQAKKATNETLKKDESVKMIKRSVPKRAASSNKTVSEVRGRTTQKKPQKLVKQESAQDKDKLKKQGKKSAREEGPLNSPPEETHQENNENKENMVESQMAEVV